MGTRKYKVTWSDEKTMHHEVTGNYDDCMALFFILGTIAQTTLRHLKRYTDHEWQTLQVTGSSFSAFTETDAWLERQKYG